MIKKAVSGIMMLVSSLSVGVGTIQAQQVSEATAINEVYGDGSKLSTVLLTYTESIDGSRLTTSSFQVDGREVTNVYASEELNKGKAAASGKYVVIELKTETVIPQPRPQETQGRIEGPTAGRGNNGPGMGNRNNPEKTFIDTAYVQQVQPVYTTTGKEIASNGNKLMAITSRTLVADDFQQFTFHDDATGIDLRYNLFVPKDMKEGAKYPLVLFMHDASGARKSNHRYTLLQGVGATIWATPESQAKHPCFVLAPQYDAVTVDDDFNTTPDLDACLSLLDHLIKEYAIDTDRIYTTGQSMGCMSSYVLMSRRPELFASAMLVAGQWDPSVMAPLSKKNLWLLTAKGDIKSSEGIADQVEVWKKNGAMVVEQEWPFIATPEERAKSVEGMLRRGGNIHYTHFEGGGHNSTWRMAYYIEGVRDWLFAQHKPLSVDSLVTLLRDVNDPTVFVDAYHGDAHGVGENSIQAVEKAVMKGATITLVEVKEKDGGLVMESSGDKLEDLLAAVENQILLLVNCASADVAKSVEKLAKAKNASNQFILYGSAYSTSLNYMARIDLAEYDKDAIDKVLATNPIAVELDYRDDNDAHLSAAIAQIKPKARICFNTTKEGLAGSHADDHSRKDGVKKVWGELIDMGGTILLTNQIKGLLNWMNNI